MRGEVDEMSNSTNGAVWPKMFVDYLRYEAKVKTEPVEEARTDSGLASSGDSVNTSPSSDRSDSQSEISHPGQYSYGELFPADENSNEVEDIRNPKVNSHGRVRKHKCKQCGVCTYTKSDFWEHSKTHIKVEKMLKCDKCPFVTEYKHHLEYHMSNHLGAKPFKCGQCDYSCVNKSMLNSHLKSHSKVYQYRCQDCNYETKYVHSLKLHLRKYSHKPAMVLNPDGTPSAHPIIDVYGTRRGPKIKRPQSNCVSPATGTASSPLGPQLSPPLPSQFNPLAMPVTEDMLKLFHLMFTRQALLAQSQLPQSIVPQDVQQHTYQQVPQVKHEENVQIEDKALDLTNKSGRSSDDDEQMTTVFDNVEVVTNSSEDDTKDRNEQKFTCLYCDISFGQEVLFSIHMGYHRYLDPFTCNRCGQKCGDKVSFFDHIHKAVH